MNIGRERYVSVANGGWGADVIHYYCMDTPYVLLNLVETTHIDEKYVKIKL